MTPTVAILYAIAWATLGAIAGHRITRRARIVRAWYRRATRPHTGTIRVGTVRYRR